MGLVDYSNLEQDIKNAEEPKTLKAGEEVELRIINVNTGVSDKNDCRWYSVSFDVPSDPMVKEFNDFFWELDQTKLNEKQFARELYHFSCFAKAVGLDLSRPFSFEDDLPGLTVWAIAGVKKSDEYGEQNTVKKYIAPR